MCTRVGVCVCEGLVRRVLRHFTPFIAGHLHLQELTIVKMSSDWRKSDFMFHLLRLKSDVLHSLGTEC